MTECEHKYRRDVETCPYCDLNEAEEERDEARATLLSLKDELTLKDERDVAREDRDEAREAARSILCDASARLPKGWGDEWFEMFPWLKEQK
jgi:hypothetical protein